MPDRGVVDKARSLLPGILGYPAPRKPKKKTVSQKQLKKMAAELYTSQIKQGKTHKEAARAVADMKSRVSVQDKQESYITPKNLRSKRLKAAGEV